MTEALLKRRLQEAPQMEPTDAVKLVYQSAFGCGHLITDRAACIRRVETELADVKPEGSASAFTPIGNGYVRLNLAAPLVRRLRPERIAAMMEATAADLSRPGMREAAQEGFRRDLERLRGLALAGATPFSPEALERYLEGYCRAGCPAVSHSPGYRAAYGPAYRVVSADFATLLPVILELDRPGQITPLIVLDGRCGAGKTTLAGRLSALYAASVIHMDDFFLPWALRTPERLGERGGNIHYERFAAQVLPGVGRPEAFSYQRFDCATGELLDRRCPAASLRVIEGSYALHPRFQAAYDRLNALTVFLDTEDPEQLRRLEKRNPERMERFREEWIPLEKSYFQAYDIEGRARLRLHSLPWEGEA